MTPPASRTRWARAAAAALALAAPAIARADAVPPPPTDCPSGSEGRTSHSGPECVKLPPTNCPQGWQGVWGGNCALSPCASDADCQKGEACVEHLTCLEPFLDPFYEYGDPDDPLPPVPPRRERGRRPAPIIRYRAVNLCSAEVPCKAPRTCLPEKLCVPKGTRGLAYRGSNISPWRVARMGAVPAAPAASAPEGSAPPEPPRPLEGTAPGCAGCTVGDAPGSVTGTGILALAGLLYRRVTTRRRPPGASTSRCSPQ
jgi:MYXO-CTERM domain-containing protein